MSNEEAWLSNVTQRVLVLTVRRRLSLVDLSSLSGIPYPTIYGYLRQGRRLPAYALFKISCALGVSISEVVGHSCIEDSCKH